MKIDFNQKIMNVKGDKPLPRLNACPQCRNLYSEEDQVAETTLADVASDALFTPEQGISGADSAERGALALDIARNGGVIDLKVDEIALIKKRIGDVKSPLIVAQAWPMLEGKTVKQNDDQS